MPRSLGTGKGSARPTPSQHPTGELSPWTMGRKNKRHTDRKGKNTFVGDVITYVENPEESTKEPLELINEFSQDTRVNYTKTTAFLHTGNKQ